jgi:hypothetical protein
VVSSGSKSCIPCRLRKCLKVRYRGTERLRQKDRKRSYSYILYIDVRLTAIKTLRKIGYS